MPKKRVDPPKPNIMEVANKKRHIFLLEKLQKGASLSRAELRELQKFEGKEVDPGVVDTEEKIAKVLGVSTRTVQFWKRDGMPVMPDGNYNIADIQAWRMAEQSEKKEEDPQDALTAKLTAIRIKREEVKLKKEMGELISKSEVEGVLAQLIAAFKRSFMSLGRSLAPQLAGREPREIDALITGRVRQIIQDFSEGKRIFKK